MLKEHDAVIRRAMAIFDAFIVSAAFLASFIIRKHFHYFYKIDIFPGAQFVKDLSMLSLSDYVIVLLLVVPIWSMALYLSGIYRPWRTRTAIEIITMVIRAVFITAIVFGAATFVFKLKFVSRAFFVIFLGVSFLFIISAKLAIFFFMRYARRQGHNFRRLLIVGAGARASQFIKMVKSHKEWGFRIIGAVDYDARNRGKAIEGTDVDVIGMLEDIPVILENQSVDEVVFIVPRSMLSVIENSLYVCETLGVRAVLAADLFELKIARSYQTDLEGLPLIVFDTTVAEEWQRFLKRAIDIILSGIGIITLSPVFLLAAILIKLTSPGPVFFYQKRVSLNNRKFILYKFRSMHEGAEKKRIGMAGMNIMSGPVFKVKDDPRITPVGKFLRKFSIDELPQLFNVFAGHMSLVGPRALPAYEAAKLETWQRRRLSMRPGLTCIWQISGRNEIGFEEWMKLDLQYIDNWSLWLDFKIILKTIPVVLFGRGAY